MSNFINNNTKFHIFSKSPVNPNSTLGGARNKSGHTVTTSEIWADKIPACFSAVTEAEMENKFKPIATVNDLCYYNGQFYKLSTARVWEQFELNDGFVINTEEGTPLLKYHKQCQAVILTDTNNSSATSNNYCVKITNASTGQLVERFVSPTDVFTNGIPSMGYSVQVWDESKGRNLLEGETDDDYICNAYAGIIQFNKQRPDAETNIKISAFEYVGKMASSVISNIESDIVTINSTLGEGSTGLVSRVETLEEDVYDETTGLIANVSGINEEITSISNDIRDNVKPEIERNKQAIENLQSVGLKRKIVDNLDTPPEEGWKENVVYLVADPDSLSGNYIEWLYIKNDDGTTGSFEKIGTTSTDLSDYATKQNLTEHAYNTVLHKTHNEQAIINYALTSVDVRLRSLQHDSDITDAFLQKNSTNDPPIAHGGFANTFYINIADSAHTLGSTLYGYGLASSSAVVDYVDKIFYDRLPNNEYVRTLNGINGQISLFTEQGQAPNDVISSEVIADSTNKRIIIKNHDITKANVDNAFKTYNGMDVVKVENNKAYDASDNVVFNIQTDMITNGNQMFNNTNFIPNNKIATWNSTVNKLVNGYRMFDGFDDSTGTSNSSLTSFTSDLDNLAYGSKMFANCTNLTSINSDMPCLIDGSNMFYNCSSLTTANLQDLPNLTNGTKMFMECFSLSNINDNCYAINLKIGDYMFYNCSSLTTIPLNLSNLESGNYMFVYNDRMANFDKKLTKLKYGQQMFYYCSSLASFTSDLPELIDGRNMFHYSGLASFTSDLPKLVLGDEMFWSCGISNCDFNFNKLKSASKMFRTGVSNNITSVHTNFPELNNGYQMFWGRSNLASFVGDLQSLVYGVQMFLYTGLTKFVSDLSSLKSGYYMFNTSSTNLDEESVMYIADTINDITALDMENDNDWLYFHGLSETYQPIQKSARGKLHINTVINDITSSYLNEICAKGWTVYVNGSATAYTPSTLSLLDSEENAPETIPPVYYYKKAEADEELGEYVDEDGNYYMLLGGQYVFGDDLSTYGQYDSLKSALVGMGLKPKEDITEATE